MKNCTNCGAESYRIESQFCGKCGNKLPLEETNKTLNQNICINPDCNYHKTMFIFPDDSRFCDICGSKTVYAD